MRTTPNGYRITKNGSILKSIEIDAIKKDTHLGQVIKEYGTYYYFSRKQGNQFIYLP